jgi:aspartyl-tRNA(Asn)/glutamyl-tRNA(Gln) amidotransferase subunit C
MKHNLDIAILALYVRNMPLLFLLSGLVIGRKFRYNRLPMSTITTDDVRHLAQLSNLQLSEDETRDLRVDLENILSYIDQLGQLDTTGVEPTYQVTGLENVWRTDDIEQSQVARSTLLALAPEATENAVKVPKVL